MELIREVVGLVRQQRGPQQLFPSASSLDQGRSIAEFRKLAPPAFKGTTDPQEAEWWIDEMEKAFRAMGCTEEEKIRFATYMLQDRAHHWWESVERTMMQDAGSVTWPGFRMAFYSKYFPSSRIRELEREFLSLSQGSMTVEDYEAEFDRLSRFAPSLVQDPKSRMSRFEEGLRPRLRQGLAAVHSTDYDDLVDRAKNMEIIWKETQDAQKGKSKRTRDFDFDGERHLRRPMQFRPGAGQRVPYGRTAPDRRGISGVCFRCGQTGHRAVECRQTRPGIGACFRCGQQGHRIAECPQAHFFWSLFRVWSAGSQDFQLSSY
ncbi:uncharacterized protein LOC120105428 [Phoenix dactylifera]|uniref:Uncharacterized protein LOC120105428 n=1 Tax=Phoenix dactylifera TaxID=42345 RepID=A0A8B8ZKF2_PHODC|nr:uncharacterized protein LOC120105428 [Phoenix dactylifera]